MAAIALGAIVNYRQSELDYGEPPGMVDEERFVTTWVNLLVVAAEAAPVVRPRRRAKRS